MSKSIVFIINPASGKKDSILWSINNALHKKDFSWQIEITQKKGDAFTFAKEAVKKHVDIVAVYGGDGTVAEVARALFQTNTLLFIIPGGTANIFAKEMGIPIDNDQALAVLTQKNHTIKIMDMGLLYKEPFVLRIEFGFAAQIVKDTKRTTKRWLGQFSYLLHTVKHLHHEKKYTFMLDIDGKKVKESGIALTIANVGNMGVEGQTLIPQSYVNDGRLDVILFKEKSFRLFLAWFISTITKKKPKEGTILYWKAKKVAVTLQKEQTIICDDAPLRKERIIAEIVPNALRVITA